MKREIIIPAYFCFMMAFWMTVMIGVKPPYKIQNQLSVGQLTEIDHFYGYFTEITDYCIKDDFAYILYGYNGILRIIDLDSEKSVILAFVTGHGGGDILFVDRENVYIEDGMQNWYCIKEMTQTNFIEYTTYDNFLEVKNSLLSGTQNRNSQNGSIQMKYASIYYIKNDGSSKLLEKRPMFAVLFQSLRFYCMAAIWAIGMILNKVLK